MAKEPERYVRSMKMTQETYNLLLASYTKFTQINRGIRPTYDNVIRDSLRVYLAYGTPTHDGGETNT